jgi:MFS family permease
VPSNILLKRFKPHIWLPITMVLWGAMLTWMGFVTSYGQLLHARAWLGVFEAGLFPGVNYYLSCWYKRNEFGIRAAIFFSAAAVLSFR